MSIFPARQVSQTLGNNEPEDESSIFLHGFSFELELVNNEHKIGPLHFLSGHFSEFSPYMGAMTEEQRRVMGEFEKLKNIGKIESFIKENKEVLIEMQRKIVSFIKCTIRFNEEKRQYPVHKSGKKSREKTLLMCWEIENSTNCLVLVVSGWKGYFTNTFQHVVEKRALVTSYIIDQVAYQNRYTKLGYWFDDVGMMRITNVKDFNNELYQRNGAQDKNPFPFLANIIDRTEVEFLPYLFKEQVSDMLNLEQPGLIKTYLSTLHFGVLIENSDVVGKNVKPHWREIKTSNLLFRMIVAMQYAPQGMLYSLLRYGDKFKAFGIINIDIFDLPLLPAKQEIAELRKKEKPYRKFYRWYSQMDNSEFNSLAEFLQESEEVLNIQNQAVAGIAKICADPEKLVKQEMLKYESKDEESDQIQLSWQIPGHPEVLMGCTLSKENLDEDQREFCFRKILRIEFISQHGNCLTIK